jgi:hypothetical protein
VPLTVFKEHAEELDLKVRVRCNETVLTRSCSLPRELGAVWGRWGGGHIWITAYQTRSVDIPEHGVPYQPAVAACVAGAKTGVATFNAWGGASTCADQAASGADTA